MQQILKHKDAVDRVLLVPMIEIEQAFESSSHLDGLIFSLCLKSMFVSSSLHYSKDRNGLSKARAMKSLFSTGYDRFSRSLESAIRHGYVRMEGDCIIANPLRTKGAYSVRLSVSKLGTFKAAKRLLEEVMLTNKIMQVADFSYRIRLHKGELVEDKKTLDAYRKSQKEFVPKHYDEERGFQNIISYRTLSKNVNVCRNQAIRLISSLVKKQTIIKQENIEVRSNKPLNEYDLSVLNGIESGFYYNKRSRSGDILVHQSANTYHINFNKSSVFKFDWSYDKFSSYGEKIDLSSTLRSKFC